MIHKLSLLFLDDNFCTENVQQVSSAQQDLDLALQREEKFWSQKAHCQWLKEGDKNTAFFHHIVKQRRSRSSIQAIKDNSGVWVQEAQQIQDVGIEYFKGLFTSEGYLMDDSLLDCFPTLLSEEDCLPITKVPDMEEIYAALQSMPVGAAAGPDGFSLSFYLTAWDVVKDDLFALVKFFYVGGKLHRSISASMICLIPKVESPINFAQYRPISVGNVPSKLCSKILNNRLVSWLPKLISIEQAGFVKGRDIYDHIELAQELIGDIDKRCRGDNVVFKLVMLKAYGRMEWQFLLQVLRHFGFSERFINLVRRSLENN